MIRLHSYHGTQNLGDAIQSLALLKLCRELRPDLEYGWVDRDSEKPNDLTILCNGWLGEKWRPSSGRSATCGVHPSCPSSLIACQRISDPFHVGSRDPSTHERYLCSGIPSAMIGCATLTLPHYSGSKIKIEGREDGIINVDDSTPGCLTHRISEGARWEFQMEQAERMLRVYQVAQAVFTSRLHVLLPCIAFGTPVALTHIPPNEERRFSLAKYLGVEVGNEPKTYDASELAAKFRAFTLSALNRLSPP